LSDFLQFLGVLQPHPCLLHWEYLKINFNCNYFKLNSTIKLQYDKKSPYYSTIILNLIIKTQLLKLKTINKKDTINSIILTRLLPIKQKNNQINILFILENSYADSLFFDSLVDLVQKYNSNINYYIIDNFNTDSNDYKYHEGNTYSYGPYSIYRSYMRDYFFNSNGYNDKFKINIKSIKLSRELKLSDIKKDYNVIVMSTVNDYYSKILSLNHDQTIILLDTSKEELKKYKIQPSSNEIFILNSFLFDQIYSQVKIKYLLQDHFTFIRKSYETYLKNELFSCFEHHDDDEFTRITEFLNFDLKK
jgi:hypothetical protein